MMGKDGRMTWNHYTKNHTFITLQWRHNGRDGASNHQPLDCLLNRLFGRRLKKTAKLRITGLCAENSPVTGEFPAQVASNAENVSIWWRRHETQPLLYRGRLYSTIVDNHKLFHIGFSMTFVHSAKMYVNIAPYWSVQMTYPPPQ